MSEEAMTKRLIIVGSPRPHGRSARVAQALAARYQAQDPASTVVVFSLADHQVLPCDACDACAADGWRCVIEDDMQSLYSLIDRADDLTVVSPVFFAGPPAPYKAVLDRLQVYFWRFAAKDGQKEGERLAAEGGQKEGEPPSAKGGQAETKRPLRLFMVGDGGDPHGFEPLIVCTRSAFAVAGFRLEDVYNGVGLDGEALDGLALDPAAYRFKGSSGG